MNMLRNKWIAFTTLLDWQDEVARAYEQSKVFALEAEARYAAAAKYEAEKQAYANEWFEKHGPRAVVLDLASYREGRVSA